MAASEEPFRSPAGLWIGSARSCAAAPRSVAAGRTSGRTDFAEIDEPTSAARRLSAEEIAQGGLFTARVIEFSETRERPVVAKHAFVREELVVRKTADERVETFDDTVRRTEVEVEDLPAERSAFSGFAEEEGGAGRRA